jgi:NAD+ kinase
MDDWQEGLSKVLADECTCSTRILLAYTLERSGQEPVSGLIVNDLVVSRSGMARLVGMRLAYAGEELADFRADGLIVATPMGSTAYAVAAGGPLISPELEVMEICPICPFLSRMKPMVVPSSGEATIHIDHPTQETFLTLDGQTGVPLQEGDVISITQAREQLRFVIPSQNSFVCKLKRKGYM